MHTHDRTAPSRRDFLKTAGGGALAAAAVAGFPAVVPASVLGPLAPSNRINVGAIGVGRISRGHEMPGIWKVDSARLVAVCDRCRAGLQPCDGIAVAQAFRPAPPRMP